MSLQDAEKKKKTLPKPHLRKQNRLTLKKNKTKQTLPTF